MIGMPRTTRAALLPFVLALAASGGCFDKASEDGAVATPTTAAALGVALVDWNPAKIDLGTVQAITERDQSLFVFGSKGVQELTGGAIVSSDDTVTDWRSAAAAPSADGLSTWLVGVDARGHVLRVPTNAAPEDVSVRYGLTTDDVQSVASGASRVAFQVGTGLAVSDGARVTRYVVSARAISANGAVVALADGGAIRLFEGDKQTQIAAPGVELVAFDGAGHLMAASAHILYQVSATWATPIFDAGAGTIHQLVGAGANVWFTVDGSLGRWRAGKVAVATGGTLAADAKLVGSASGDTWAISGGQLLRWNEGGATGDQAVWNRDVQPVHAAICSKCHGPAGSGQDSSRIDLSTYDGWVARKDRVYLRVVTQAGTPSQMPPASAGSSLSDAQRAAIAAWSKP